MTDSSLPPEVSLLLQSWRVFAPDERFLLLAHTPQDTTDDLHLVGVSPQTNNDENPWWQQQTGKNLTDVLELAGDTPSDWLEQLLTVANEQSITTDKQNQGPSHPIATIQGSLCDNQNTRVTLECSILSVSNKDSKTTTAEDQSASETTSYIMAKLMTEQPTPQDQHSQFWHLHELAETSFDPVVMIDTHGTIVFANPATQAVFGYTVPDELIGQPMSLLCGGAHAHRHQSYVDRYVATGQAHKIGTRRQVQARHKDGHEFPVALGLKEIRHANGDRLFVSYINDLSKQLQHEQELEYREREVQAMIDASFDPMIQIDHAGIIHVVNQAAIHLFGYTRKELIGHNMKILCGGMHAAKHDEYLRRYHATGQKRMIGIKRKELAKRKDGSEFPIELGVQEVKDTVNGQVRFCAFIRDLTETNMLKRNMMKQQELIQDSFFGGGTNPPPSRSNSSVDEGGDTTPSTSEPGTPTSVHSGGGTEYTRGGRPRRLRNQLSLPS